MPLSEDVLLAALESVMEQNRQLLADGTATRLMMAEIQGGPMQDLKQLLKLVRDGNGTPSLMSRMDDVERWQEQQDAEKAEAAKSTEINWGRITTVVSLIIAAGSLVIALLT